MASLANPLTTLAESFRGAVARERVAQPLKLAHVLGDADLDRLPGAVQRHLRASGVVGRPVPQNMLVDFDVQFRLKPGKAPLRARSIQYNFFGSPARLFFMKARVFGVTAQGLHLYRNEQATFQIRAARAFNVVDQYGPVLSAAETVTVLNDMCVMAPATLIDDRLAWESVDGRTATVTFTNGARIVRATLEFDAAGRLINFWSDDRPDASGGEPVAMRWSTPVGDYRNVAGMSLPTRGSAVYAGPDAPFEYGVFTLRTLRYDVRNGA